MKARELMTHPAVTVQASQRLDQAARLMREHECGCTPIVDADAKVVGILTDRDVCMAALREDRPLSQIPVELAMNSGVHSCGPDDTIEEAERLMGLHQVRRLPVVDEQSRALGVLSLDDIALEARREEGLIRPPISAKGVGVTLGQIDRPHLSERPG